MKMFSCIRNFFVKDTITHSARYVVLLRGIPVYESSTAKDAEQYIRDQFDQTDSRVKSKNGWRINRGVSRHKRWIGFRSSCKIVKLSTH